MMTSTFSGPPGHVQQAHQNKIRKATMYLARMPNNTQLPVAALSVARGCDLDLETAVRLLCDAFKGPARSQHPEAEIRQHVENATNDRRYEPGFLLDAIGPASSPQTKEAPPPAARMPLAKLVRLDSVKPEPVRWLWPGRIAEGKITMIAGDPGGGKSTMTVDLAARVSKGAKWPDGTPNDRPGGVVMLNAEDDVADTVAPRFLAAGGDVTRGVILQAVRFANKDGRVGERLFSLDGDLEALEEAVTTAKDCRLVVVDPVSAYLGGTDSHNNAEVRGLLAPLADFASKHRVAVVLVTHLNKNSGGGGQAMYRFTGSNAFVAASRAAWLVTKDKDSPQRRLFLPVKNNLGPDQDGLAFTVEPSPTVSGVSHIAWEAGRVVVDVNEALADPQRDDGENSRLDEAAEWLQALLATGPIVGGDVKKKATESGMSWRTIERAKKKLGVKCKPGGQGAPWVWYLPDSHSPPSPPTPPASRTMADTAKVGGHWTQPAFDYDAEERAAIIEFDGKPSAEVQQ